MTQTSPDSGRGAVGPQVAMPRQAVGTPFPLESCALERGWRVALMDAIDDAVVILDDRGTVLAMNTAFAELTGFSLDSGPHVPPYPW